MDNFSPFEIPFYQDDPFLFPDTFSSFPDHMPIFQDLQLHGSSNPLISGSSTPVLPSGESHPVFTAGTTSSAAAAATAASATTCKKGKRGRKPSNVEDSGSGNPADRNEKRAVHRDVERQRRQEMAHLYASLRTLLPLEYIKGKRAITDHIHQATNYIKQKETAIRELKVKRNKLKHQLGETSTDMDVQTARTFSSNITFTAGSCSAGGIEILMKSDLADDWFPLSRVLNVLLKEGLAVVNCTYTKLNQKFHCTIRTDVGGRQMNDEDLCFLREKLDAKVAEWKSWGANTS